MNYSQIKKSEVATNNKIINDQQQEVKLELSESQYQKSQVNLDKKPQTQYNNNLSYLGGSSNVMKASQSLKANESRGVHRMDFQNQIVTED